MFLFFQITYLYVLIAKFSMPDFIPVTSIIVCLMKAWPPISLNHPFTTREIVLGKDSETIDGPSSPHSVCISSTVCFL